MHAEYADAGALAHMSPEVSSQQHYSRSCTQEDKGHEMSKEEKAENEKMSTAATQAPIIVACTKGGHYSPAIKAMPARHRPVLPMLLCVQLSGKD